jgi:hypothetical protein
MLGKEDHIGKNDASNLFLLGSALERVLIPDRVESRLHSLE